MKNKYNKNLAEYFAVTPNFFDGDKQKKPNIRKCAEQPWQQTNSEMWDEVTETLCDLNFIQAKCAAGIGYYLIRDYYLAMYSFPEAREEAQKSIEDEQKIRKYRDDLIAFSNGEISSLDIIQSIQPWTDEEFEDNLKQNMNGTTHLVRIRPFFNFVNSEIQVLTENSHIKGFYIQHAWNFENEGPLVNKAEKLLKQRTETLMLNHPSQRPIYNQHPALLRTIKLDSRLIGVDLECKRAFFADSGVFGVLDIETNQWITAYKAYENRIERAINSASGNRIIASYTSNRYIKDHQDNTVKIWNLEDSKLEKTIIVKEPIENITATPNGNIIVFADKEDLTYVWDIGKDECLKSFQSQIYINSISINPNGKYCILGGHGRGGNNYKKGIVEVWNLETGKCTQTKECCETSVVCIVIFPIRGYFLTGGADGTIKLWSLNSFKCRVTINCKSWIRSLDATPDGRIAVSAGDDGNVCVWDLKSGECLRLLIGHAPHIYSVNITPDGKRVVSAGGDEHTLRIWDIEKGRCIETSQDESGALKKKTMVLDPSKRFKFVPEENRATFVDVAPNVQFAISANVDGTIKLMSMETCECINTLRCLHRGVTGCHILSDNRLIVGSASSEDTSCWIEVLDPLKGESCYCLQGAEFLHRFEITPDERLLLLPVDYVGIRIWNLDDGQPFKTIKHNNQRVWNTSITPDGRKVIVSVDHESLWVWDLNTINRLTRLKGYFSEIGKIVTTPDGKTVITVCDSDKLIYWNVETGQFLRKFNESMSGNTKFAMNPDGKTLVSAGKGYLKVWDLRCREVLTKITTDAWLFGLNITPDGKKIVTWDDKNLKIWNIENNQCITVYHSGWRQIFRVSHLRPDSRLVVGLRNGDAIVLNAINLRLAPPIVTPIRLWLFGRGRFKGIWDEKVTVKCPWCGQRFSAQKEILDVILCITQNAGLKPAQSPCLELPKEAWEDPGLLSECPKCNRPLKFNPFIVDNRYNY
ncbi:MAG: WD40 repeat domain-containing protein [Calditrichaeota bacterium]|nr:WD40 repeat domain-containing protein [Calditrichota bacterium]